MTKPRTFAITIGVSLLLMTVAAGVAFGYIHSLLIDAPNSIGIGANVAANKDLFLNEILLWLFIALLDFIISFAMYGYFNNGELKGLNRIMTGLRVVYTFILIWAISSLGSAYSLARPDITDEVAVSIASMIQSFDIKWNTGLILFGFHLVALGILTWKHRRGSKLWAVLLLIAGAGYVLVDG